MFCLQPPLLPIGRLTHAFSIILISLTDLQSRLPKRQVPGALVTARAPARGSSWATAAAVQEVVGVLESGEREKHTGEESGATTAARRAQVQQVPASGNTHRCRPFLQAIGAEGRGR